MKFAAIAGRQQVKERLVRSIDEGRVPHAMLFAGPAGNGDLAFALAFATYLQCTNRTDGDSCGECPSCVKHQKLVHPDLHFSYPYASPRKDPKSFDFIDEWRKAVTANPFLELNDWYDILQLDNKQGSITVNESAELMRKLSLKSFESPYKIQIIWHAEKLNTSAFNKLLKVIEEPPENTIFILTTNAREQLLPTILSRTQLIKIPVMSNQELISLLEVKKGIAHRDARRIAGLTNGNMNAALAMASDDTAEKEMEKAFIDWMRLCFNPLRDFKALSSWIDEMAGTGREYQKQFLVFFQETIRECLMLNSGATSLVKFDDDVIPNFSKFSKFIHTGNAAQLQLIVNQAHYAIGRNANPKILFLDLSFKISRLLNAGQ
jgi:DNA polymerase III subunit delta'